MLRDRFRGIEDKNLHRLAVTEMGHAAEQATLQFYKDSDIDQYQYLATLESHTCEVCAHLDERIFYVKDEKEGINYTLIHPYCRCTTTPYMKDLPDVESRWYHDPITGKGKWTRNMNYREWAKAYDVKPLNKKKFLNVSPVISTGAKRYIPRNLYERSLSTSEEIRQHRYSIKFYETLRNSNRSVQVEKITKASKLDKNLVKQAIEHILDSKYHLINIETFEIEYMHFYPDVDMAHSLERLLENKPMEHDILMLKHEALEAKLMDDKSGKFYDNYEKAHKETNKKYAYDEKCRQLREQGILPNYKDIKKEGEN